MSKRLDGNFRFDRQERIEVQCANCSAMVPWRDYFTPAAYAKHRFCSKKCSAIARCRKNDTELHAIRFWDKVDKSAGPAACWPWTGHIGRRGYGRTVRNGKIRIASRVAWILTHGAVPDGLHVCHRCDNRPCCNPLHLFLGTNAENVADKVAKGRQSRGPKHAAKCKPTHGEAHRSAKLTTAQAEEIRRRYAEGGVTQRELAAEYGVNHGSIGNVTRGTTWKKTG